LYQHDELFNLADRLSKIKSFSFVKSRFEIDESGSGYSDARAKEFEKMESIL